jgi:hypothetical protein
MNSMATRSTAEVNYPKAGTTDFVLHKSQQSIFTGIQEKIVDYSEHRLLRYAESITDKQQQMILFGLLSDYKAGKVAIAWKRGRPLYLKVTKDI